MAGLILDETRPLTPDPAPIYDRNLTDRRHKPRQDMTNADRLLAYRQKCAPDIGNAHPWKWLQK